MPKIVSPIYEPTFEIAEDISVGLQDFKIGDRVKVIVNYTVVEKTKRYTVFKVSSLIPNSSARRF